MIKRLALSLVLLVLICGAVPGRALAAATPPTEKGLLITPVRQFLSGDAGRTTDSTFSIANLTDKPLNVALSVQQFSVTDYSYNYQFQAPKDDWLHLSVTSTVLQPHKSQDIGYSLRIPRGSAPGGHYYTLFASANLSSQGVDSTIQAADLVYLTVSGKLSSVSHLQSSSIHWLSFGHDIPFSLQPINTGNIYSYVYVSGQLHGLFVRPPTTSNAHLLMPGKVRDLSASIPSPVLPGIYLASYGYKTDSDWIIQQSHLVVFIPPWFIAFVLAIVLIAGKFLPRRKRTSTDGTPAPDDDQAA
jgi:hypothetical protein